MSKPQIVILGAGPAALGAAFRLTGRSLAHVTVIEQNSSVGGNAGSFELASMRVDYGSHRLHPSCDPQVLHDIRALLGEDLLIRPRHGRIRLRNRWIHFPLKPIDLAVGLPAKFSLGVATDLLRKLAANGQGTDREETFASVLEKGLGRTICRDFYFPFVRKIWGLKPEELAVTLARRRISANSLMKMGRKVLSAIWRPENHGGGRFFFYPRHGYGQISEAYCRAAREAGADIVLGCRVQAVEAKKAGMKVVCHHEARGELTWEADYVWSTIPITALAKCLIPALPEQILRAAENIRYRAMILIYLVLEVERFTEFDAHYFPEVTIPISRLSEPKNYSNGQAPKYLTVLCAELPCSSDGPEWNQSDEELGRLVCDALAASGIPVRVPVRQIVTRRLRQAYPIYRQGYEAYLDPIDRWLDGIERLLTFGRQGLFAHDNTHHALYTAYCAVDCLAPDGRFDREQWHAYRKVFENHVVED